MPATDLGFYADMKYGYDFWRFFGEEIFDIVHEFFPGLSTEREDTFVAGLSMGGFGTLKLGIMCPERFAAAASLSGMVDLVSWYGENMDRPFELIYGTKEEVAGSINDLPYQLEQLIASGKSMPKFYMTCGTEDFLYPMNVSFRDRFKDRIDLTYHEEPGSHEWEYWDRNIKRIINWLPIKANEKEVK
jgi:S-formylglutathione hydrolase FrmB